MRLLASIVVILALTIMAGFWTNYSLQKSTNDLVRQIDKVSIEIRTKHWQSAKEQTEKLEKDWDQKAKWWPVFLDHQEMDNIDFSMARVKEYVTSQNNSLSLGQLSEIRLMLEHIPKKEAVNLENIL
ncbi:MAG: DUF4363 family protein [Syntrophomonas sp.]